MEISAINNTSNINLSPKCACAEQKEAATPSSFKEPQDTAEISQGAMSLSAGTTAVLQGALTANSSGIEGSIAALANSLMS